PASAHVFVLALAGCSPSDEGAEAPSRMAEATAPPTTPASEAADDPRASSGASAATEPSRSPYVDWIIVADEAARAALATRAGSPARGRGPPGAAGVRARRRPPGLVGRIRAARAEPIAVRRLAHRRGRGRSRLAGHARRCGAQTPARRAPRGLVRPLQGPAG